MNVRIGLIQDFIFLLCVKYIFVELIAGSIDVRLAIVEAIPFV